MGNCVHGAHLHTTTSRSTTKVAAGRRLAQFLSPVAIPRGVLRLLALVDVTTAGRRVLDQLLYLSAPETGTPGSARTRGVASWEPASRP